MTRLPQAQVVWVNQSEETGKPYDIQVRAQCLPSVPLMRILLLSIVSGKTVLVLLSLASSRNMFGCQHSLGRHGQGTKPFRKHAESLKVSMLTLPSPPGDSSVCLPDKACQIAASDEHTNVIGAFTMHPGQTSHCLMACSPSIPANCPMLV